MCAVGRPPTPLFVLARVSDAQPPRYTSNCQPSIEKALLEQRAFVLSHPIVATSTKSCHLMQKPLWFVVAVVAVVVFGTRQEPMLGSLC